MERLDPLQPFLWPRHSLSHSFHPQAEPIWRQPWTMQHLAPEPELPDQDLPSPPPPPSPPSPSPPSPCPPSPWPPSSSPLVGPSPPSRGRHGDSEGVRRCQNRIPITSLKGDCLTILPQAMRALVKQVSN